MANTEWAKKFFDRVTSELPDLLTKHGEGGELVALDELRGKLVAEADAAKKARAKELQAELDALKGPTESAAPMDPVPAEAPKKGSR